MVFYYWLKYASQSFYQHRWPKIILASLFSFGKIFSSAGGALFSTQQTLKTYHVSEPSPSVLAAIVVVNNILLTTGTRAPPIFKKLLRTNQPPTTPSHQALSAVDPQGVVLPPMSAPIKALYYTLLTLGYLSTPFSALNAYLSGITLINTMADLDEDSRMALASFVTACSMMSYYSFNLHKMHKNVLRCCQALNARWHGHHVDLSHKTIIVTLINSVFGVIAGVGTAYISTSKSLDLFPLTKDMDHQAKTTTVLLSVIASLFSSAFIFGISAYDQVKMYLEPSLQPQARHQIPYYAKAMVLVDSVINSLLGFIGIIHLLNSVVHSDENDWRLVIAGLLPLLNNIFMSFSLGLVGCHSTTQWLQHQKHKLSEYCWPDKEYPPLLSQVIPPPLASDAVTIDVSAVRSPNNRSPYSPSFFKPSPAIDIPEATIDNSPRPLSEQDIPPPSPSPPM